VHPPEDESTQGPGRPSHSLATLPGAAPSGPGQCQAGCPRRASPPTFLPSPLERPPVSPRSSSLTDHGMQEGIQRPKHLSRCSGEGIPHVRKKTGGLRSSRVNGFADLSRATGRSRGKMRSGCVVIAFIGQPSLLTIKGASAPLLEEQISRETELGGDGRRDELRLSACCWWASLGR
jgi:hypothetical protein